MMTLQCCFLFFALMLSVSSFATPPYALPLSSFELRTDSLHAHVSLEHQIDSLHQRLAQASSDSLKFPLRLALAELYIFHSFKHHDDDAFRQAELDKALILINDAQRYHKTPTSRALECAALLERARFQPRSEAILTLDMCQKELADILRENTLHPLALTLYGALGVELGKIPAVQRLFASWFYRPIPTEPPIQRALLYLLQAKLLGQYRVFVYWKLGEAYMQVRNARDVVTSLRTCLELPEEYPYFDTYCKSQARLLLEQYLAARKSR